MAGVVHFEIPTDDLNRAKEFYASVFGWDMHTMPMGESEYTTVTTTPVDEKTMMPTSPGAINGGMMERSADTPAPVITIGVDSIDKALEMVGASGGAIVQPRTEIPGSGAFAYFTDSEGNVLGLWENAAT